MDLKDLARVVSPIWRRVLLTIGRGLVRAADDSPGVQELQLSLMRGEERSRIERFGSLGVTSVPMAGAEAVVVFVGGNRDHGVVVAVEDRSYRPKGLKGGETAVYDATKSQVYLRADGRIVLQPSSGAVEVHGDLEVSGDVRDRESAGGKSMQEMRDIYDLHVHPDPQGGTSGPPTPTM